MARFHRSIELVAAAAASALLTILYVVYVGRTLGPAEYSDFSASLSLIQLIAVALSPLAPTIARIAARCVARGDLAEVIGLRRTLVRHVAVYCVIGGALSLLVMAPVAHWLRFRSPWPLVLAVVAALLFALLSAERGVLQGLMRFRAYNISLLLESGVRLGGVFVALAFFGFSAAAALASYAAGIVIASAAIALLFWSEWGASAGSPVDWKEFWKLALPMLALMTAAALFQNVDMLAVKRWFAPADAGYYGAAVALSRGFGVLFVPLYVLVGPSLTDAHEKGLPTLRSGLRIVAAYIALCLLPLIVFVTWPEPVITLLFGKAFAPAGSLIALLGGVSMLLHIGLLLTQIFVTFHDFRFLWLYGVAAILAVLGLAIFHRNMTEIFTVLYTSQAILLAGLVLLLFRLPRWSARVVRYPQ
jgi:O-antigen/teichoic acid export membrane protein